MCLHGQFRSYLKKVVYFKKVNEMLMYIMKSRDNDDDLIDPEEDLSDKMIGQKGEEKPKILSQSLFLSKRG